MPTPSEKQGKVPDAIRQGELLAQRVVQYIKDDDVWQLLTMPSTKWHDILIQCAGAGDLKAMKQVNDYRKDAKVHEELWW
eukprot:gene8448-10721_t